MLVIITLMQKLARQANNVGKTSICLHQRHDNVLPAILGLVAVHLRHVNQQLLVFAIQGGVDEAGAEALVAGQMLGGSEVYEPYAVVGEQQKVAAMRVCMRSTPYVSMREHT